jgi:hypothetical protein
MMEDGSPAAGNGADGGGGGGDDELGGGSPHAGGGGRLGSREPRAARIRWDEPTLAAHDLERGTRKKIAEPKTPFRPPHDFNCGSSIGSAASDDAERAVRPDDPRLAAALGGRWDTESESGSHGASMWRGGRAS